jgi:hypothetical protein
MQFQIRFGPTYYEHVIIVHMRLLVADLAVKQLNASFMIHDRKVRFHDVFLLAVAANVN